MRSTGTVASLPRRERDVLEAALSGHLLDLRPAALLHPEASEQLCVADRMLRVVRAARAQSAEFHS